ncbi:hypothetical protein PISMIDRAFT_291791 [Pisolithus microcarpus 441]|uniref:Unplaced genomic scaffold scaffold_196, whole genome shotgun sequence n=1 Tax=Pisolithus microcarpus 441 TaxID=765257 RepID=A0A0C9Z721_9AGAM|nr:hypothetical protein PISMIDRAFT_291791 [Pisolithus microcarpus 441]
MNAGPPPHSTASGTLQSLLKAPRFSRRKTFRIHIGCDGPGQRGNYLPHLYLSRGNVRRKFLSFSACYNSATMSTYRHGDKRQGNPRCERAGLLAPDVKMLP